jgi:hypothetical protein
MALSALVPMTTKADADITQPEPFKVLHRLRSRMARAPLPPLRRNPAIADEVVARCSTDLVVDGDRPLLLPPTNAVDAIRATMKNNAVDAHHDSSRTGTLGVHDEAAHLVLRPELDDDAATLAHHRELIHGATVAPPA